MTDKEVHILVKYDPEICLHIDGAYGNVSILSRPPNERPPSHTRRKNLRLIHTARTANEINSATQMGFWPLLRRIDLTTQSFGDGMQVWQNQTTGEVFVQQRRQPF